MTYRWLNCHDRNMIPSPIRILAVLGLLLLTLIIGQRLKGVQEPTASLVLASLPNSFPDSASGQWDGSPSDGLGVKELDVLKLDQYIKRFYRLSGGDAIGAGEVPINVYVGYWKRQTGDYQGAKHSPSICLPSSGWVVERRSVKEFQFNPTAESSLVARQLVASAVGHKALFTYWFFTAGDTFYDEWQNLFYVGLAALFKNRTDGGIVTLSVPFPNNLPEDQAQKLTELITARFIGTFAGKLSEVLQSNSQK